MDRIRRIRVTDGYQPINLQRDTILEHGYQPSLADNGNSYLKTATSTTNEQGIPPVGGATINNPSSSDSDDS